MATSPEPDRSSIDDLSCRVVTMMMRQDIYESRVNEEIRDVKKETRHRRRQRDLMNIHKREVWHRQECLEGNIKAVEERVDDSDRAMRNLEGVMSVVKAQVRNLEAGELKKQVAELDLAIKKTREEHQKEIIDLCIALKDTREENDELRRDHEKLCREYKSFKKTTLTKFEMIFSRLGDLTEEIRDGDESEDHEMEEDD